MLHPLLKVMIKRPELIIDHLHNYLDLFKQETRGAASNLVHVLIGWVLLAAGLLLFLILGSIALMLGLLQGSFHWILAVVPCLFLLLALIGWSMMRKPVVQLEVAEVKRQFSADIELLQAAGDRRDR